jgi:hypothetical protein
MIKVNPDDYATKLDYWEALARALAMEAEKNGIIVTIERKSAYPLAMRNHYPWIEVWEKR